MTFAHPNILWIATVIVPLTVWYIIKCRHAWPTMSMSSIKAFAGRRYSIRAALRHSVFVLLIISIAAMTVALARPQSHDHWDKSTIEGTDIVIAIDISSSMLAMDLQPDRLGAAKKVASEFVNKRDNDNIGLVIFAAESLTGVPLTSDHAAVIDYISSLKIGMLEDGTAIGDGLATAINRIKDGPAVSKSIILLTDGSNNTGIVRDPLMAADIAKDLGIRIYTIGVGTNGKAPYPVTKRFGRKFTQYMPVEIDEAKLQEIASRTGGKYYRATSNDTLKAIFEEIDSLDKTVITTRNFSRTDDEYEIWALIAALSLLMAVVLRQTIFRTFP